MIEGPEPNKHAGVLYAVSDAGLELPIIDVSSPAFALSIDAATLQAMEDGFLAHARMRARLPGWLFRFLLRKSVLMEQLKQAERTQYLGGLSTYLFKLGPDLFPTRLSSRIDRAVAASIPALSMRLRLQDIAHLLAESLGPRLDEQRQRPLLLLNLAGGPSIDSLNALILLRHARPAALAGRRIDIHTFDIDAAGASFGARALHALLQQGAPLHGLAVTLHYHAYDWTCPAALRATLEALAHDAQPVLAVSTEGGLFEYASDELVVQNLQVLHACTPSDASVSGSVTHDGELVRLFLKTSRTPLKPRSATAFARLAGEAGFVVRRSVERPMCRNVLLLKA